LGQSLHKIRIQVHVVLEQQVHLLVSRGTSPVQQRTCRLSSDECERECECECE
jgi:hypothetical protein